MKKQLITTLNGISLLLIFSLITLSAKAQKEKVKSNQSFSLITQAQIDKIKEIVAPVRAQIDKLLNEDKRGRYKAYLEEVKGLENNKSPNKTAALNNLKKKYTAFFNEVWSSAGINEEFYQKKIKEVFPEAYWPNIIFYPCLTLTIVYTAPAPAIVPDPPPTYKCVDICPIAAGEIKSLSGLVAGGNGSYGNCYVKTNSWSTGAVSIGGRNDAYGYLRNNVTIPGTFPSDNRKLRIKKNYELNMEASSFGVGFALSEAWSNKDITSSEYIMAMVIVLGAADVKSKKTMSEDYVLEKADVARSNFLTYSGSTSAFGTGSWAFSECNNIKWTICEEK